MLKFLIASGLLLVLILALLGAKYGPKKPSLKNHPNETTPIKENIVYKLTKDVNSRENT
jgi:hypothetical protein